MIAWCSAVFSHNEKDSIMKNSYLVAVFCPCMQHQGLASHFRLTFFGKDPLTFVKFIWFKSVMLKFSLQCLYCYISLCCCCCVSVVGRCRWNSVYGVGFWQQSWWGAGCWCWFVSGLCHSRVKWLCNTRDRMSATDQIVHLCLVSLPEAISC